MRFVVRILLQQRLNKVDSGLGRLPAPVVGEVLCSDALRLTAEVSELQIRYNLLAAQLVSFTLECATRHSLTIERGNDIMNIRPSVETSNDGYKLPESQVAVIENEKEAIAFERDA